jgi:glyceraldehyde 3-phosphate dehydrogenase
MFFSKQTIAINGFGRIGKQFFLACLEAKASFNIIINELAPLDAIVYSLKYDSVHPSPSEQISHDGKNLIVGKKKFKVFQEADVTKLPWKTEKVDLVVECTGLFTEKEKAILHINAGAKRVLISAPAKGQDITLIYGINNASLKKEHTIISAGSCTTNCATPILKIINDTYQIQSAYFVTTHAFTATQRLIDSFDKKDFRRGRAASENITPSTSGASQSVVEALPELKGKLDGYALRVPVIDGSITSVIAKVTNKPANKEAINELFKQKAQKELKGVLEYCTDALVSSDIINNNASCILDSELTSVNQDLVSVAGWYDNEFGYSHRLFDVAQLILKLK